jgi:hypothetical protein
VDQGTPHKTLKLIEEKETLKFIEQKVGKSLKDMGTGETVLNRTAMSCAVKSGIDKWDLIKLQSFCKAKDIVSRTIPQPPGWKKIFTNLTSHRGLIINICKELKKLDSREPNNPILKWSTIQNIEFTTKKYLMAEKHLEICSISLVIRENAIQNNPDIPPHTSQNG